MILVAVLAFFMKEPPRGQFEKQDVLGEVIEDEQPAPISMEAAFARIKRIRTIRTVLVGFCALGFGLFSQPALESLYLDDNLHVNDVLERGLILSLSGILALPILPFVGRYFDRKYREDPATRARAGRRADPAVGAAHAAAVQRAEHHLVLDPEDPAGGAHDRPRSRWSARCSRRWCRTACAAWAPRCRRCTSSSSAASWAASSSGFLTDAIGVRGTVIFLGVPSAIIGGALLMNGARFIRNDLSLVVEELLEEQDEHREALRRRSADIPLLQLANIDFSYGPVQVLFGVDFEVRKGETRRAARHQRRRASRPCCA